MGSPGNEWAPITDADLLGPETAKEPPPDPLPQEEPRAPEPPPLPLLPPTLSTRPKPIYTIDDWEIFDFWVHRKGFSIDQAAHCAGIAVYDALVALQQRNPWFYEFKIMVGPQGNKTFTTRRQRGMHTNITGQGKDYERVERPSRTSDASRQTGRPSEDDARRRFLALLGDASPDDYVDGRPVGNHHTKATHPGKKKKKKVRFTSRKCRACGGSGHDARNCKELRESDTVPAGLEKSPTDQSEGYEGTTAEERE